MKALGVMLAFVIVSCTLRAQLLNGRATEPYTRADTLRGMLRPERTSYDLRWYGIDVRVDPARQFISGSVTMRFTVVEPCLRMQVDLFDNMTLESTSLDGGAPLHYERQFNAVFVSLPSLLKTGTTHDLLLRYSGTPRVAKNPPWDGGFIWTKDEEGNPWVAVACQGTGASLWWPNKDHQADKPDSVLISVTVPPGLEDVSNGRLRDSTRLEDGWMRYRWAVTYPINNYDVTVNIGKFAHFGETFVRGDTLDLDYFVLPSHLEKARAQFVQARPMIACFEHAFGPYPFARDGYKLVESPHLGMEHQSAVAYGNGFQQGYRGMSGSEWGLKFDFIIVHESAHEWWGNSVTAKDIADMWIHESFAAYAEALYVECAFGRAAMLDYINAKKHDVANRAPIIGTYNVNKEGSQDMYPKGALMLHTLRSVLDNDSLFFSLLRGMCQQFRYQTVAAEDIISYVNAHSGSDYTSFFNQYLRHAALPRLDVMLLSKGGILRARYRWHADEKDFHMPVKVTTASGALAFIQPTSEWQSLELGSMDPAQFQIAVDLFYIDTQVRTVYQLP
ncbi:MAG TPA: M1 family metallopeptidase [Bacteroidota bacterium]|nr:M1 family metallopeptidase [Bacteroidota bacterium]